MRGLIGKSLFAGIAALALVAFGSAGALAATKKLTLWPENFTMAKEWLEPGETTIIGPDGLQGHGAFYAPVSLPVGAVVKRVFITYSLLDPYPDPDTSVYFNQCMWLRRKLPTAAPEDLIQFSYAPPLDALPGTYTVNSGVADVVPGAPLKIKSGYRYYVNYEPNFGGVMRSLQIEYTTP